MIRTFFALALLVTAGCDSDSGGGQVMKQELTKICNAVELSGAPKDGTTNDIGVSALWISQNVRSREGIAFLQGWAKLGGDKAARYKMLEDAAHASGLSDCPLLAYWR